MNKEKLKKYCRNIGLDLVGIADVGPYYDLEKIIKNKLSNGYFTGMEEEVIEKRVDPKLTMENAKSIIVCAFPYYSGEFEDSNISKYCYGKDYHIVVKEYLQNICDFISTEIESFEYKIFADNGPLVDRYLAYLSGIGYFGINNNIITDKYGSYVFLGEIITDLEIECMWNDVEFKFLFSLNDTFYSANEEKILKKIKKFWFNVIKLQKTGKY